MKYLAMILAALVLTGCGTYGEPLLLSRIYDRADPCQSQNAVDGKTPNWCGASGNQNLYINGRYYGSFIVK